MPSASTNRAVAYSRGIPPSALDPPMGSPATVGVWLTYQGAAVSTIKHKRTWSGALGGPCGRDGSPCPGGATRGTGAHDPWRNPESCEGERASMSPSLRSRRVKGMFLAARVSFAGGPDPPEATGAAPATTTLGEAGRLRRVTSLKPLFLVSDRPVKGRQKPSPYPCRKRVSGRGDQAATWRS